eukprot:2966022-Prymnesium_polylepis.2
MEGVEGSWKVRLQGAGAREGWPPSREHLQHVKRAWVEKERAADVQLRVGEDGALKDRLEVGVRCLATLGRQLRDVRQLEQLLPACGHTRGRAQRLRKDDGIAQKARALLLVVCDVAVAEHLGHAAAEFHPEAIEVACKQQQKQTRHQFIALNA